jgi:hypothetical protein
MMETIGHGVLDNRLRGYDDLSCRDGASLEMTVTGSRAQKPAKKPYAVRTAGLRLRARLGCTASGPCRCANSIGLISAAGFGGLNR